jgi:hypothetical protein
MITTEPPKKAAHPWRIGNPNLPPCLSEGLPHPPAEKTEGAEPVIDQSNLNPFSGLGHQEIPETASALIVMDNVHLYVNRLPGTLNRRLPGRVIFLSISENTQMIPVYQRRPRCPKPLFITHLTLQFGVPSAHWDLPEK